jgi:pseudaminic acid cytidylyltransferase
VSDTIAIIPARGGSKRLPRKNILDFHGKPIIAYTIAAALDSGCFGKVVVSTDDSEIAEVAARHGAQIALRDPQLATDSATVAQVCLDLLAREEGEGNTWERFCCLYPTAPLRDATDIRATVALLERGVCDFAMAVTRFSHYPHQALKLTGDGVAEPMWPDLCQLRSDRLPELAADNGSTYAVFVDQFRQYKTFWGPRMKAHKMPLVRAIDIDTAEDFHFAWCLAGCVHT